MLDDVDGTNPISGEGGEEQKEPSGWPYEEDRMILRLLDAGVRAQVTQRSFRGAPSGVRLGELIDSQLQQFYGLLAYGNAALKGVFSEGELLLIASVVNGTGFHEESVAQELLICLRDLLRLSPEQAEQIGVDGYQTNAKVEALDTLARYALVDVIERWWALDDEVRRTVTITSLIEATADPKTYIHMII